MILCTTALFLSGYAIQQRTLRDLRKAIRPDPRPSPKIYLPDRFKGSTTELEDGTVINIDEQDAPSGNEKQQRGDFVIEVRPTVPEGAPQKPLTIATEERPTPHEAEHKEDDLKMQDGREEPKKQKKQKKEAEPLSRAERRRRIKAEIQELSQGESPMYYQRRLW